MSTPFLRQTLSEASRKIHDIVMAKTARTSADRNISSSVPLETSSVGRTIPIERVQQIGKPEAIVQRMASQSMVNRFATEIGVDIQEVASEEKVSFWILRFGVAKLESACHRDLMSSRFYRDY